MEEWQGAAVARADAGVCSSLSRRAQRALMGRILSSMLAVSEAGVHTPADTHGAHLGVMAISLPHAGVYTPAVTSTPINKCL